MIPFKYPNLTIIDESEVEQVASAILGRVIVARIPDSARQSVCHDNIRDALQEEFEIDIEIEKISRFGPDYLILADSPTIATQILNKGSLAINSFTVALLPWTTEYGSITVPLHTQLPNIQIPQAQEQIAPCNQHVAIEISGLPPHLCYQSTLHQLFSRICAVTDIKFIRADLQPYQIQMTLPPATHITTSFKTKQPATQATVIKLLQESKSRQNLIQIMMLHHEEILILMSTNRVGSQTAVTGKQTKRSYLRHHMNEKRRK